MALGTRAKSIQVTQHFTFYNDPQSWESWAQVEQITVHSSRYI